MKIHKTTFQRFGIYVGLMIWEPYMLALAGQPSLHGYDACMVYWNHQGALRRNCRQKQCETSISPYWVFLFSRNPTKLFKGLILWYFYAGRARHPGPPSQPKLDAGVGVVSLCGAPLALPTFATAQFKSFFDCGRAVRCLLPLASGRFLHLFGYQGADADAEQLTLTDQLFDAAICELRAVVAGQPCLLVGDFNVEPTKILCQAKGISAGLWVDFGEAWALAAGLHPAPTCKRGWTAVGGHRRDFILGCPLAAAVLSCKVQPDRWIAPHLAVRALFDYCRWETWVLQPVQRTPLWPASWLPVVDKSRGSKSAEVLGGLW